MMSVYSTSLKYSMMKSASFVLSLFILFIIGCQSPKKQESLLTAAYTIPTGVPVSVMMTAYSTTLLANGKDHTLLSITVIDSLSRQIMDAVDSIHIYVNGDGTVTMPDGTPLPASKDTAGLEYGECQLHQGIAQLVFTAGTTPDKIKVEARSGKLWPGGHEIHTLPADFILMTPQPDQLPPTSKPIGRMIGADISFLPQIEDRGQRFTVHHDTIDAIALLKSHGFNTIRLRIFVEPANEKGYSPGKGYCGLTYTLAMAKRVKAAGMKYLLDFHYSDYWADPQQQNKPARWADLDFNTLRDSVRAYTADVLRAMQAQGTLPDMVQIGNEINHGILWPDGHIGHPDQLAELLKAGVAGAADVDPHLPVMMHLALGGQHQEAVFWLDNMLARGVTFDIIGLSYYPRWHGTLDDLNTNLYDLINRYHKPVNVVEYSNFKKEVHDIVFGLPDDMGKGACIWEPLNERSGLFDKNGEATDLFSVYDEVSSTYLNPQKKN